MSKGKPFLERFAMETDIGVVFPPGRPLVEISGDRRVLIENHLGVKVYSRDQIVINVKFGCIQICGCGLELRKMSKDQLVVLGEIQSVILQKRKKI